MSVIATALKHLIAAGVSGDDLVRAVAEMEAAMPLKGDATAEKRRAYDRERKRNAKRNSTGIPPETVESEETTPPPNDIYSNPPPVTPTANAVAPLSDFSNRVEEFWNAETAGTPLPKSRAINGHRRKHLEARRREHGDDAVFEAIRAMCASDFHSGRSGKWTEGNLGWLLKSPENFQKMLERADAAKPAAPAAKRPADPAYCRQQIEFFRKIGQPDQVRDWERKLARSEASGPTRGVGQIALSLIEGSALQ